jgi:hypothetical protein
LFSYPFFFFSPLSGNFWNDSFVVVR